jgi:hypothetical protein
MSSYVLDTTLGAGRGEKDPLSNAAGEGQAPAAGNGLSKQPRTAPVLVGNVAHQISGVVAHAPHLDHAFLAAAIEKKMPRRLYAPALHSAPAELQMVRAGSFDQDLRAFRIDGTPAPQRFLQIPSGSSFRMALMSRCAVRVSRTSRRRERRSGTILPGREFG